MQPHNFQPFQTSHSRWRAVTQRDPAAHCSFIYGVTSTKIYCRPTCTARVARRANVVYFETRKQASDHGYRPCTKCKPDEQAFIGQREEVVLRTLDLIRVKKDGVQVEGGLKELAKNVGVTPSYLCRVFKKTMGYTIGQYCRDFDVAVSDASEATSPARSSSAAPSETPTWAWLPEPLSTASSPPPPLENLVASLSELPTQSSAGNEDLFDVNFDFAEWIWSEGFDFNDWTVPDNGIPPDDMHAGHLLWLA